MACSVHSWWFDTPCPQCVAAAAGAADTATVTNAPPAESPWPEPPTDEQLEIPPFLQRNPDNTFAHPEPLEGTSTSTPLAEQPTRVIMEKLREAGFMSDRELHEMASANMSIADRQPYLMELRRREDKKKTRERIQKMLDAKTPEE